MVREFLRGVGASGRAIKLLVSTRSVRRYALMPLLINLMLFAIGLPLLVWLVVGRVGALMPADAFGPLRVLLEIVVAAALVVGSVFAFTAIGGVIAAPFHSLLARAVEEHLTGRPSRDDPRFVSGAFRSIITALGRLLLFAILYPLILATALIPVAGVFLQPILTTLYGAFVLSLDFSDPVFERHIPKLRDRMRYIGRRKSLYLGFGLVCVGIALVPILNFFLLPVGVTAAAILFVEENPS
ncbi:MAG: EI24 domain-containing protein [Candidatus Kapaibacterium sp.]